MTHDALWCGLMLVVVAMGAVMLLDGHDGAETLLGFAQIAVGAISFTFHLARIAKARASLSPKAKHDDT